MKKILIVMITIVSLFTFMGCSQKTSEINVPVTDIMKDIKTQIAKDMKANGVPEESFKEGQLPMYMESELTAETPNPMNEIINKEDLEEGMVLELMINIKSDLIIVLKAKDDTKVENLKTSLEKVKEKQSKIWEAYLPDQYEKVKNTIIKSNGNYLVYITYDDAEKIEAAFDNALK